MSVSTDAILFYGYVWDDLVGKPCRAERARGTIIALGHYIEDKWVRS